VERKNRPGVERPPIAMVYCRRFVGFLTFSRVYQPLALGAVIAFDVVCMEAPS